MYEYMRWTLPHTHASILLRLTSKSCVLLCVTMVKEAVVIVLYVAFGAKILDLLLF